MNFSHYKIYKLAVFPSPKAPLWSSAVGRPRPSTPPPPGAAAARSRPAAAVPLGRPGTSRRRLTGGVWAPSSRDPKEESTWINSGRSLESIYVHSCWPYWICIAHHWTWWRIYVVSSPHVKNLDWHDQQETELTLDLILFGKGEINGKGAQLNSKELNPELILSDASPMKGINSEVNSWERTVNGYSLLKNQFSS